MPSTSRILLGWRVLKRPSCHEACLSEETPGPPMADSCPLDAALLRGTLPWWAALAGAAYSQSPSLGAIQLKPHGRGCRCHGRCLTSTEALAPSSPKK